MYALGDHVEYHDVDLGGWRTAVVHSLTHEDLVDSALYVVGVQGLTDLGEGVAVFPEQLRWPLRDGEACRYYSPREGRWLAAVILGPQELTATEDGYTVKLKEDDQPMMRVPGSRLHRTYHPGDWVQVFDEPSGGWINARVLADIEPERPPGDAVWEWIVVLRAGAELQMFAPSFAVRMMQPLEQEMLG